MPRPIELMGLGPKYDEARTPDGQWVITVTPPKWVGGGPGASVTLSEGGYDRYRKWRSDSTLIEDALPELTMDQREILMTGIDKARFHEFVERTPPVAQERTVPKKIKIEKGEYQGTKGWWVFVDGEPTKVTTTREQARNHAKALHLAHLHIAGEATSAHNRPNNT